MTEAEIDDIVDRWHSGAFPGQSLHEALGWTWEEYGQWFKTGLCPQR